LGGFNELLLATEELCALFMQNRFDEKTLFTNSMKYIQTMLYSPSLVSKNLDTSDLFKNKYACMFYDGKTVLPTKEVVQLFITDAMDKESGQWDYDALQKGLANNGFHVSKLDIDTALLELLDDYEENK
jgi:hypothetical protein